MSARPPQEWAGARLQTGESAREFSGGTMPLSLDRFTTVQFRL